MKYIEEFKREFRIIKLHKEKEEKENDLTKQHFKDNSG